MIREGPGTCFIDHLLGGRDMYPVVRYKIGNLEHWGTGSTGVVDSAILH